MKNIWMCSILAMLSCGRPDLSLRDKTPFRVVQVTTKNLTPSSQQPIQIHFSKSILKSRVDNRHIILLLQKDADEALKKDFRDRKIAQRYRKKLVPLEVWREKEKVISLLPKAMLAPGETYVLLISGDLCDLSYNPLVDAAGIKSAAVVEIKNSGEDALEQARKSLVISEVLMDPRTSKESAGEFIEIYNTSTSPYTLYRPYIEIQNRVTGKLKTCEIGENIRMPGNGPFLITGSDFDEESYDMPLEKYHHRFATKTLCGGLKNQRDIVVSILDHRGVPLASFSSPIKPIPGQSFIKHPLEKTGIYHACFSSTPSPGQENVARLGTCF